MDQLIIVAVIVVAGIVTWLIARRNWRRFKSQQKAERRSSYNRTLALAKRGRCPYPPNPSINPGNSVSIW